MRTDQHRPSVIVPAEYRFVFSYSLCTTRDGYPIPSINVDCELEPEFKTGHIHHAANGECCIVGLSRTHAKFAETGGTGKCSVCGTNYVYGDIWQHIPTGEYIHIGHNCADKYNLLADRSAWELALGRVERAIATQVQKALNAERREAFLTANPGLEAALNSQHHILSDLSRKLTQYGSLSKAQIDLAFKIATELVNKPVEVNIPAPVGNGIKVQGEVVSVKTHETMYGLSTKMTVKVRKPEGIFLVWTTVPRALMGLERGKFVEFTANLEQGRDAHFAIGKRPRNASMLAGDSTVHPDLF